MSFDRTRYGLPGQGDMFGQTLLARSGLSDRSDRSARVATSNTSIAVRPRSTHPSTIQATGGLPPRNSAGGRLTRHSLPRRPRRHPPARIDREETSRYYPAGSRRLSLTMEEAMGGTPEKEVIAAGPSDDQQAQAPAPLRCRYRLRVGTKF